MKRLKTALVGLGGVGETYLSALLRSERIELCAMADPRADALRRIRDQLDVATYEDYRSLIVEGSREGLESLVVALEPFESLSILAPAAECGLAVLHKPPAARTTAEMSTVVALFANADRPFDLLTPWRSEGIETWLRARLEFAGRLHTAHGFVSSSHTGAGWRGDAARAGGGVLLNDAYAIVDHLVRLMGVPETVFARCAAATGCEVPRNYDTEDAVAITLSFSGERIAVLSAVRRVARSQWWMTVVGERACIELTQRGPSLIPHDGAKLQSFNADPQDLLACSIDQFARTCLDENGPSPQARPESTAHHKQVMAVIETAYLSAKTASPESPAKLLSR